MVLPGTHKLHVYIPVLWRSWLRFNVYQLQPLNQYFKLYYLLHPSLPLLPPPTPPPPPPPPPSTSESSQPRSLPADVGSSSSDYGSGGGNGDQRLTTGGKRGGRGKERSTWGGRETKQSHRKPKRVTDLSPRTEITYPDSLMSYNIHEEGSVREIGRGRDVSHCS